MPEQKNRIPSENRSLKQNLSDPKLVSSIKKSLGSLAEDKIANCLNVSEDKLPKSLFPALVSSSISSILLLLVSKLQRVDNLVDSEKVWKECLEFFKSNEINKNLSGRISELFSGGQKTALIAEQGNNVLRFLALSNEELELQSQGLPNSVPIKLLVESHAEEYNLEAVQAGDLHCLLAPFVVSWIEAYVKSYSLSADTFLNNYFNESGSYLVILPSGLEGSFEYEQLRRKDYFNNKKPLIDRSNSSRSSLKNSEVLYNYLESKGQESGNLEPVAENHKSTFANNSESRSKFSLLFVSIIALLFLSFVFGFLGTKNKKEAQISLSSKKKVGIQKSNELLPLNSSNLEPLNSVPPTSDNSYQEYFLPGVIFDSLRKPILNEKISRAGFVLNYPFQENLKNIPENKTRVKLINLPLPGGTKIKVETNSFNRKVARYLQNSKGAKDESALFNLNNLVFSPGSSSLVDGSYSRISKLAVILNLYPNFYLRIEGHTDSLGDPEKNQILSERRAAAVRNVLVKHGVQSERIRVIGFGHRSPIADNSSLKGRAQNRRVDLQIIS